MKLKSRNLRTIRRYASFSLLLALCDGYVFLRFSKDYAYCGFEYNSIRDAIKGLKARNDARTQKWATQNITRAAAFAVGLLIQHVSTNVPLAKTLNLAS